MDLIAGSGTTRFTYYARHIRFSSYKYS